MISSVRDRQRNGGSGTDIDIEIERELERQRLEEADRGTGPIRRRIKSFTIKLEPFAKSLTDEEAISVRNAIESLLQDYFFEVQPWAVKEESELESGSGSVTYVGLAQILENKQTEDHNGVELTMNGLVYFAEGSQNIPDENELLQTMEEQALGDSTAVVEALKDLFPTQQAQQLVVTIETPAGAAGAGASAGAATGGSATEVPEAIEATTTIPPYSRDDLPNYDSQTQTQTNQAVAGTGSNQQQSPFNAAAVGGGIAFAAVVLVAVIGLFAVQRRRKKACAYPSVRVRDASGHGSDNAHEYLVGIGSNDSDSDLENGFALLSSQDDWKANSKNHNDSMVGKNNVAIEPVSSQLTLVVPTEEILPAKSSPTAPELMSSPTTTRMTYLSSIFQRKNPIVEEDLEVLSSVSSNEGTNPKHGGSAYAPGDLNMSNYEFTDDGSSDFDDVVSIQPHVLTLQSLESFEEQHTSMTRHEYVVQKDQLESPFEEQTTSFAEEARKLPKTSKTAASSAAEAAATTSTIPRMTNTPTGVSAASSNGDLSYSSSSVSSRETPQLLQQNSSGAVADHQELEDDKEDQRIRYSMMPNPYVQRRATKSVTNDRSARCVLKATDFTAASLAGGQSNNNNVEAGSLHSPSNGMGMVPKLSAPSWWSSSSQEGEDGNTNASRKRGNGRSSAAAKEAYEEGDLAYSGDEENTFGVPSSDGWDPADTELSSLGDALTQEEINMVEFHSGQMIRKKDPPASEPASGERSPTRRLPSKKIEAAKSVLQKIKSSLESNENKENSNNSSSSNENLHKLGESIASIASDGGCEEINFDAELMEI
jgi:hypothetical protein